MRPLCSTWQVAHAGVKVWLALCAGASWQVGRYAALELSALRADTAAGEGLDYVNRIYTLTFVYRR